MPGRFVRPLFLFRLLLIALVAGAVFAPGRGCESRCSGAVPLADNSERNLGHCVGYLQQLP